MIAGDRKRARPRGAADSVSPVDFPSSPTQNAPAAVAVFMAVLLAGGGFLWLAVSTKPENGIRRDSPIQVEIIAAENSTEPREQPRALPAPPKAASDPITGAPDDLAVVDLAAQVKPATENDVATETVDTIGELLKTAENELNAESVSVSPQREIESKWGAAPNLKPTAGPEAIAKLAEAATTREDVLVASTTPRLMQISGVQLADDYTTPFFFRQDVEVTRKRLKPLAIELVGDLREAPREVTVSLSKGETFVDALKRAGVNAADRNAAAFAFGEHQNLRTLRPGQTFHLTTAPRYATLFQEISAGESENRLLSLVFRPDKENKIELIRTGDAEFKGRKEVLALTTRLMAVQGRIDGSLYASAKAQGAPDKVIADLANMFAYDVDFQREVFGGDEYEAIFEVKYDAYGNLVGAGDILYGRLNWRGRNKEKGYYRFTKSDERADYFDANGEGAKRLLMKTPIDGARLSSGFGRRKHPILGYARAHKGVDFAASRGTPIKAAGDGVIERADRYGSFGNYVRIRHANGYKTAYAHLNGFAKGIRAGKRVDQGDIIGYVGTTGRSTGPHLHYEVHLNGQAVNPQNLKIATGVQLTGSELSEFRHVREMIDQMRLPPQTEANASASTAKRDAASAL